MSNEKLQERIDEFWFGLRNLCESNKEIIYITFCVQCESGRAFATEGLEQWSRCLNVGPDEILALRG